MMRPRVVVAALALSAAGLVGIVGYENYSDVLMPMRAFRPARVV